MKLKTKKILIGVSLGVLGAGVIAGITSSVIIYKKAVKAGDTLSNYLIIDNEFQKMEKQKLNVLAVGDSLTAGYNDRFNKINPKEGLNSFWSYADYVAKGLKENNRLESYSNIAISGLTTDTLTNQMKEQANLKKIQNADFIMLTIGGNDIMKALSFAGLPFSSSLISGGADAFAQMMGTVDRSSVQNNFFQGENNALNEYTNTFVADRLGENLSFIIDGELNKLISPQLEKFDNENLYSKSVSILVRQLSIIFHDIRLINKHVEVVFIQPPNPFMNWPDKLLEQKNLSFYKDGETTIKNNREIYDYYIDLIKKAFAEGKDNIFIDPGFHLENVEDIQPFMQNRYETMPYLTDIHPSLQGHKYIADDILQKFFNLKTEDIEPVSTPVGNFVPYNCESSIEKELLNCILNEQITNATQRNHDPAKTNISLTQAEKSIILPLLHGLSWGEYQFRLEDEHGFSLLDNPIGKLIELFKTLIKIFLGDTPDSESDSNVEVNQNNQSSNTMGMVVKLLSRINFNIEKKQATDFAVSIYYHFSNMLKYKNELMPAWDYENEKINATKLTTKTGDEWKTYLLGEMNSLFTDPLGKDTTLSTLLTTGKTLFMSSLSGVGVANTKPQELMISQIERRYGEKVSPEIITQISTLFKNL